MINWLAGALCVSGLLNIVLYFAFVREHHYKKGWRFRARLMELRLSAADRQAVEQIIDGAAR